MSSGHAKWRGRYTSVAGIQRRRPSPEKSLRQAGNCNGEDASECGKGNGHEIHGAANQVFFNLRIDPTGKSLAADVARA